jgi:hypothetical protein
MSDNTAVRQALLKPAFKHLYPGLRANEWLPASVLLTEVNAISRRRGAGRLMARHALDPKHFEFRGTPSAGANQVARELRMGRRNRQHPRDHERPPDSEPLTPNGATMDDLTYEVLAWLAFGNSVFRPREAIKEAEEAFRGVLVALQRLRDKGFVAFLDGHITQTGAGIYLMVGPVMLTPAGKSELERDRSLGARFPWSAGPLPWRS